MKEKWYEESKKKTIEKVLKECNYENASRRYFENVKIKATPVHVEHEFCNGTDDRLKEINVKIDFGEEVLQEFEGDLEEMEIKVLEVIKELVDGYITVCIENPES